MRQRGLNIYPSPLFLLLFSHFSQIKPREGGAARHCLGKGEEDLVLATARRTQHPQGERKRFQNFFASPPLLSTYGVMAGCGNCGGQLGGKAASSPALLLLLKTIFDVKLSPISPPTMFSLRARADSPPPLLFALSSSPHLVVLFIFHFWRESEGGRKRGDEKGKIERIKQIPHLNSEFCFTLPVVPRRCIISSCHCNE